MKAKRFDLTKTLKKYLMIVVLVISVAQALQAVPTVKKEWFFNSTNQWASWTKAASITDANFSSDGVTFRTSDQDPYLLSPYGDWNVAANNNQWIEIDMDLYKIKGPYSGQFFYSNTSSITGVNGNNITLPINGEGVRIAGKYNVESRLYKDITDQNYTTIKVAAKVYEPSANKNRNPSSALSRSLLIMLRDNSANRTGAYLAFANSGGVRKLGCYSTTAFTPICNAVEDQWVEIIVKADTGTDKFSVKYNGTWYTNGGSNYSFFQTLTKIDQVRLTNLTGSDAYATTLTETFVDDIVVSKSLGDMLPVESHFAVSGEYDGWAASGVTSKTTTYVNGLDDGEAVKLTGKYGTSSWLTKSFSSDSVTYTQIKCTAWVYELSSNCTANSGLSRSLNLLMQDTVAGTTGVQLSFANSGGVRKLGYYNSSNVFTVICDAVEDRYAELVVTADTGTDKFWVQYDGVDYDNGGSWYPFKANLTKINQTMFSNSISDSGMTNFTTTYVDDVIVADSFGTLPIFSYFNTIGDYDDWSTYSSNPATDKMYKVSDVKRQTIRVWPFWEKLGTIQRLRFDVPNEMFGKLYSIRILEDANQSPSWTFNSSVESWVAMHHANLSQSSGNLVANNLQPQGLIITPVTHFDANSCSILNIDASCAGERALGVYWKIANDDANFVGVPIPLTNGSTGGNVSIDLRQFPEWTGTITHLGLGFGTFGKEKLLVNSMSIANNDADLTFLRADHFEFKKAINREENDAVLLITLNNAYGPEIAAGSATFVTDTNYISTVSSISVPQITSGSQVVIEKTISLVKAGTTSVTLQYNNQSFTKTLRIDPAVTVNWSGSYDVPEPNVVPTGDYELGVFYYPGWSGELPYYPWGDWKTVENYPEREPVLGFYQEGMKEVADWHIKWAVENGIKFFIYDWYWDPCHAGGPDLQKGREALENGFLRADYNDLMKFTVMVSADGFSNGWTEDALLTVTDYLCDNYFSKSNFLTVDGKPYIMLYNLYALDLPQNLGSDAAVKDALIAIRQRVVDNGYTQGVHISVSLINKYDSEYINRLLNIGFDSVTEYAYGNTRQQTTRSAYREYERGHREIWDMIHDVNSSKYTPILTAGWDKRPWRGVNGWQRFDRRSEDFAEGLKLLKDHLDRVGIKMAFIEAWNEFGEGSYIEPTADYGFGSLEAIRSVFASSNPNTWPANIGPDDVNVLGKYDIRPFRRSLTTIMDDGFEDYDATPLFVYDANLSYDYDPCSPQWTIAEYNEPGQIQVFDVDSWDPYLRDYADPSWIHSGAKAVRFRVLDINEPHIIAGAPLDDTTLARWTVYAYIPSLPDFNDCYECQDPNTLVNYDRGRIDFVICGHRSDNGLVDRAALAKIVYSDANTAQLQMLSSSSWQNAGPPLVLDTYHKFEMEVRVSQEVNKWYMRIDNEPYDNDGLGWNLIYSSPGFTDFTSAEIQGNNCSPAMIFYDDVKTEKLAE